MSFFSSGLIRLKTRNTSLVSPDSFDLEKRIIKLSLIDAIEGKNYLSSLLWLDSQSKQDPIHCYISSFGGSVHGGLALIDAFNYIKAPIYTYCLGHAMSMGAVLLAQGTKGHRYAFKNSTIMIHEVSSFALGTISDIEVSTKEAKRLNTLLATILSEATGKSISKIQKDIKKDFYLSAYEAQKYGIVDKVI